MNIGSTIHFGGYLWKVLDIKKRQTLIITDQIIEQRDYRNKKEPVTWETSEIRHYLNNDFIEKLPLNDRNRIISTKNRNADNPWYGCHGGDDTVDKIFLLSLDEVVRLYFGNSSRLLDYPKPNQRYWFDRKDGNNEKRKALFMESNWWWWTRSPGKNNGVAVYVHGDGNIGIQGNGISKTSFNTLHYFTKSNKGGLRPAMWIDMESF